jgi:hypothetical protein
MQDVDIGLEVAVSATPASPREIVALPPHIHTKSGACYTLSGD